jgi:hypothetical protein
MQTNCPQCSQQLPEAENIEYRFCPHCGAEIAAEALQPEQTPDGLSVDPQGGKKPDQKRQLNDHTIAPQSVIPQNRPEIKPPPEPPPPSFFRIEPIETDPPPPKPKKQPLTKNHHKVIIAVLILLAVVILILGGLFTF